MGQVIWIDIWQTEPVQEAPRRAQA